MFVIETFDIDCDGIGFGWNLVAERPRDDRHALDLIDNPPVDVSRVMTVEQFNQEIAPRLDDWGLEYWNEVGYASSAHSLKPDAGYERSGSNHWRLV